MRTNKPLPTTLPSFLLGSLGGPSYKPRELRVPQVTGVGLTFGRRARMEG